MQRPPAASAQVIRSIRAGWILLFCALFFLLFPLYGWFGAMPVGRTLVLALVWCVSAFWLAHCWRTLPQGRLHWDGDVWHWSDSTEPLITVRLQYDFQTSVWLLLEPSRGRRFSIWVDADPVRMPQWQSFRRALTGSRLLTSVSGDVVEKRMRSL